MTARNCRKGVSSRTLAIRAGGRSPKSLNTQISSPDRSSPLAVSTAAASASPPSEPARASAAGSCPQGASAGTGRGSGRAAGAPALGRAPGRRRPVPGVRTPPRPCGPPAVRRSWPWAAPRYRTSGAAESRQSASSPGAIQPQTASSARVPCARWRASPSSGCRRRARTDRCCPGPGPAPGGVRDAGGREAFARPQPAAHAARPHRHHLVQGQRGRIRRIGRGCPCTVRPHGPDPAGSGPPDRASRRPLRRDRSAPCGGAEHRERVR